MKKLLTVVVVLALIGGAWYAWSKHTTTSTPDVSVQPVTSKPDASNATFSFEDGPVTLKDGTSDNVDVSDYEAYGDVNGDGKNDTAVILVQSGGGSGVFVYLAAYVSGNVAYKGSNAVFIGDRVSPQTVSINSTGDIKVTYLDRGPNEPMASEPTILTTKTFSYKAGQLVEK